MKFQIVRTRNKQFRVKLIGDNGETLAVTEAYTRKQKAEKVIDIIIKESFDSQVEDKT